MIHETEITTAKLKKMNEKYKVFFFFFKLARHLRRHLPYADANCKGCSTEKLKFKQNLFIAGKAKI